MKVIWLFALYFPRDSSLPPTEVFVLNLVGWLLVLFSKFMIFWYSILAEYIFNYQNNQFSYNQFKQSSTIICCCFSGDIYICTDFFVCIFGCTDFVESSQVLFIAAFVILSTVLFPTKSPVTSAAF